MGNRSVLQQSPKKSTRDSKVAGKMMVADGVGFEDNRDELEGVRPSDGANLYDLTKPGIKAGTK